MKYLFSIALILLASSVWPDTETLVPDGLGSPDAWAFNTTGKVADVTDGVDGQYIFEVTDEDDQVFSLTNTTFDAGATINSIQIVWRGEDNGSGNNRVQFKLVSSGGDIACEGANQALTTSWVTYNETPVTATPTGTGCDGALTKALIDGMLIRVDCTSIGASRENRVTDIDVIIDFTPPSEGKATIMRTIIQ